MIISYLAFRNMVYVSLSPMQLIVANLLLALVFASPSSGRYFSSTDLVSGRTWTSRMHDDQSRRSS